MEPKKLTESQVKLMIFLYRNKKRHTRKQLLEALDFDRGLLSNSIRPLAGYFIKIGHEKNDLPSRKAELISLTEGGTMAIQAWMIANR